MSAQLLKRLSSVFATVLLAAPLALPAANFPYPQNRSYAYGFKPAPFGGSAAADATTILNKYNSWISQKRVTVVAGPPATYRIQAEDLGGDTVSEGISYGMLLAVYFNDQTTFDGLWRYKVSKNDGLGLMHWRINSGGAVVGSGSATDADEDIAFSLYLAHYQWGSAGTFNYKALADAEMTKIVAYDLDSNRVKPGDSFNDCRYPSYFFPNEYRVFGKEKPGDLATWTAVRNNSYATIAAARNATTGLLAEQCTDNGQGGGCSVSSTQYKYNSARIPLRMAIDYVYYGDTNAQGELNRLVTHFGAIAPGSVGDCYNLNGTSCSSNNHGAFVGPAGTAFMVNGAASLQSYYNFLMVTDYSGNYFGGAISLLSLLLLSGNMPNFADQGAMFTPTRTSTVTPYAGTPTVTPTQTPLAFAYVFEDFENALLINSYSYAGPAAAPTPVISQGLSNAQNNTAGGAFSNRVQVQKPTNGQYAGVGFDSSYAPASGVMNFTGSTTVRLAVKTDTATSIQLSFREGAGINGGDDEVWNSTVLALPASASWQVVSFTISAFTENIYNPSCASTCLTTGNNTFNLGSVKAFEIAFPSIIAATANIYIDDIAFIPSVVPTSTNTKTPFPNPYSQLYDDFESANSLYAVAPKRVTGYANTALGASIAVSLDTTTYVAGAKSGRLNYNLGTAPTSYGGGFSFMSPYNSSTFTSPDPLMAGAVFDASGAVQLQLWLYAPAGLKYRLTLQEAGNTATPVAGADGESWYSALLTGNGSWQRVTVDIGDLVEDPYNPTCNPAGTAAPGPCLTGAFPGNNTINLNGIWNVGLKLPGEQVGVASRTGSVYLDDVTFITNYKSPTITRTFTPGATSPTSTPTASPSRTPSPTASPTSSRTASPTASATRSSSPSPTRTASPSPSASASPSVTPSRTLTTANSPTASGTVSPTGTQTATRSATRTASPSATPSASPSATRSATPSGTSSATRSASPTRTATPTVTATFTDVPVGSSPTDTPTISPTFSATPTNTRTASPSASPSATPSASPSATRTASPSASPSATASSTQSPGDTPTVTPSFTASPLASETVSPTPTPTFSVSPADTATGTPTDSPSLTASPSATAPALSATASPTSVPGSATASPTTVPASATATNTAVPASATASPTTVPASVTATNTAVPASATASPTMVPASATATRTAVPASPTLTRSATPPAATLTSTLVVPVVSGVSPGSAVNTAALTLAVSGSGFAPGAVVVFGAADLSTAWAGGSNLQATVPAGTAPGSYTVTVRNPDGTLSTSSGSVVISGLGPTATPAPTSGLPIIAAQPFPNPNPQELRVLLGVPADQIEVRVYSRAMVLLGTAFTAGPLGAGWHRVTLPSTNWVQGQSFYTVISHHGSGTYVYAKPGSFVRF